MSEALETGKVIVCNDILVDERSSPLWAEAERLGCRSYVILPLVTDGQALGLIQICSKETNRYDDEELKLLYEMREDVAYAIVSIRTEKERLRSEEALKESEAKLKDAQALARIGSWNFEIESQKITWSDQTHKLYGRNPALGPPTVEEEAAYYSPEQVQMLREYSRRAIEEGKCFEYDLEAKLLDGKHVYFSATMRPLKDAHGKVVELFGTVQDITERKQAEEALRESEEKYRMLFTGAREAIFIADAESGILLDCNEAACSLIERSKEELIGKHQSILHPPDELVGEFTESFRRHIASEKGHVLNARVVTKSGVFKDVEIKANVIDFRGKKIIQGFFTDITERKRMETLLQQSMDQIRLLLNMSSYILYRCEAFGDFDATYISDNIELILGYKPDEFLQKGFWAGKISS